MADRLCSRVDQYARQLAALGVEIGVLEGDGSLEYVAQPGEAGAVRRHGRLQDDERPYWTWESGDLQRADEVLLATAGVKAADTLVLHFLAPSTIEQLSKLEKEHENRQPEDIWVTRFALKRTFRGYEAYVAQQLTR